MIRLCQNNRQLIVANSHLLDKELLSNWIPFSIFVTSSFAEKITEFELKNLIELLVFSGAKTFVCMGPGSETLHDNIDAILLDLEEDSNVCGEVITTYHPDEPVSDVVNYFIYGTEIKNNKSGGLLAFLSNDDYEVLVCIQDFCSNN